MKVYIAQAICNKCDDPGSMLGGTRVFDSKEKLVEFMKTVDNEDEYTYWVDFEREVE
ncbi:hypothetical protein [Flavobacterium sp.]|uniref:hypothetical protein n=1 Tax=Flavobacterium sp. TaxID=239 RepID=UPI0038FD0486